MADEVRRSATDRSHTFVLVHGAWRGGWCYAEVATILRGAGHRVFAPTLTGLGERSHLAVGVNLETHITDIINVLLWERLTDVVLVGHSYGGMIITAVADRCPDRIASLIYLDAAVPVHGDTVLSTLTSQEAAGIIGSASGTGTSTPPPPAAAFGHDADANVISALSTPHPLACFTQAIELTGTYERITDKAYVLATNWAGTMALPHYERVRHTPNWLTERIHTSHDMMVDDPQTTAATLLSLVARFEQVQTEPPRTP